MAGAGAGWPSDVVVSWRGFVLEGEDATLTKLNKVVCLSWPPEAAAAAFLKPPAVRLEDMVDVSGLPGTDVDFRRSGDDLTSQVE